MITSAYSECHSYDPINLTWRRSVLLWARAGGWWGSLRTGWFQSGCTPAGGKYRTVYRYPTGTAARKGQFLHSSTNYRIGPYQAETAEHKHRSFWFVNFYDNYERASAASERSLFNITENSQYERPGPAWNAFQRLISQQPLGRLICGLLCWVAPSLLPHNSLLLMHLESFDLPTAQVKRDHVSKSGLEERLLRLMGYPMVCFALEFGRPLCPRREGKT